jgi:hypothetical protein
MDPMYGDLIHNDQVSPFDIKMGRGGHTSNHHFHQSFLDKKDILRVLYLAATTNREKRAIQQMLVDFVHAHGGRFIRKVNEFYYMEIDMEKALNKAASALREDRIRKRVAVMDAFEMFEGLEDLLDHF